MPTGMSASSGNREDIAGKKILNKEGFKSGKREERPHDTVKTEYDGSKSTFIYKKEEHLASSENLKILNS